MTNTKRYEDGWPIEPDDDLAQALYEAAVGGLIEEQGLPRFGQLAEHRRDDYRAEAQVARAFIAKETTGETPLIVRRADGEVVPRVLGVDLREVGEGIFVGFAGGEHPHVDLDDLAQVLGEYLTTKGEK